MALKPDRMYNSMEDISRSWPTGTVTESQSTAGGVVSIATASSGVGLDAGGTEGVDPGHAANVNTVSHRSQASGAFPVGMLTQDILNDQSNEPRRRNLHKNVAYVGGKVHLIRKGWVVTDRIVGNPTAGAVAYLFHSGYISATGVTDSSSPGGVSKQVGRFETSKDQDGFARVFIDL